MIEKNIYLSFLAWVPVDIELNWFPNSDISKFQYLYCYHRYLQAGLSKLDENICELDKDITYWQYGPDGISALCRQSTTTLEFFFFSKSSNQYLSSPYGVHRIHPQVVCRDVQRFNISMTLDRFTKYIACLAWRRAHKAAKPRLSRMLHRFLNALK